MRALLFLAISLTINGLLAWYVWRRLVRDTGLPPPWRRIATIALIALQLLVPTAIWTSRLGAARAASLLGWPAFLWMAFFGCTVVALAVIDLARLLAWTGCRAVARRDGPADPSRRQALMRLTGAAAVTIASGEVALGMREALGEHRVVDVPVTLPNLDPGLDGFTIVQITDVHVGMTVTRDFVADLVARANALAPDLIALTGDLVDGRVVDLAARVEPIGELRAPHGVFFVTGNHEYYSGVEPWLAHLRTLGVRVLRNERVAIARGAAAFDLAGIDDHSAAQHAAGHGPDLERALAGRDRSRPVVLLAHQPRQARVAARHGVDLQLSGHTHGGQIWPWHYLASAQQGGLLAGRYQIGPTQLYVSRGAGYWGPPVRIGAPAELTRVILRAQS